LSAGTLTIPLPPFTTIADLATYLSKRPANTAATASTVVLNVSDLEREANRSGSLGFVLYNNSTKYVYLDLSGSTITEIPYQAFCYARYSQSQGTQYNGCTSLTGITIPNSITSIGDGVFYGCKSFTNVTFTTGSNISSANFGNDVFPEGSNGSGGNTLKTAYNTGKAGTYTREAYGSTWTKQN